MSVELKPGASGLRARVEEVRRRVEASAARAGRDPREVRLVAVSKTHPSALVREAIAAGLSDFGENRVQEAEEKIVELKREAPAVRWHLVGHLQANKAPPPARLFDLIQSADSPSLGERLGRVCGGERSERR